VVDVERQRLERRMHGHRHIEVLRSGEDRIVARVAVRHPRDRERTDEGAAAAVVHRAPQLACGGERISQ
jgi:hypothetical protein